MLDLEVNYRVVIGYPLKRRNLAVEGFEDDEGSGGDTTSVDSVVMVSTWAFLHR